MLYLALLGAIWVILEPSCIRGESLLDARARIIRQVLRNPLFYLALGAILFALTRALNGGIALALDFEASEWSIRPPYLVHLPGSVAGAGWLPLATAVAATVLTLGVAHALGRTARMTFLVVGSFLAGVSAFVAVVLYHSGHEGTVRMVACASSCSVYLGVAYGIWLVTSLVTLFMVAEAKWRLAEPFVASAMIFIAIALMMFAPQAEVVLFLVFFVVVAVSAVPMLCRDVHGGVAMRCALIAIGAICAPLILTLTTEPGTPIRLRMDEIIAMKPFTDGWLVLRGRLSKIALAVWKESPWIGSGLGSFPLDIRFLAADTDWQVIRPGQQTALNGWWQLLAERGLIGMITFVAFGVLAFLPWVLRMVGNRLQFEWRPVHLLSPLVLLAVAAVGFASVSLLDASAVMATVSALAVSGASVPPRKPEND